MKKLFILLTIGICISQITYAQKYDYDETQPVERPYAPHPPGIDVNRVRFGAFISPDISWMHPTASQSDDGHYFVSNKGSKIGYNWGLMAEYFFAPNYGIATGFDLATNGGKIESTLNTAKVDRNAPNTVLSSDFNYKLQFLEIPFNLKLRSDPLGDPVHGVRIFGQIGLTTDINISRKATFDITYNDQNGNSATLQGSNVKLQGVLAVPPIMLQMNVGAGIEYPIAQKLLFYTGLFFNNGFLPSAVSPQNFEMGYAGSFTNGNVRLNNFALRVGLFF
ncbi:MAG TPA: outer membrane beta-barrel protein [Flavipsychrobacter sp.]|nr:outer membrane beta-barrel protein [Flavipsychrobacter sp.]